MGIQQLFNWFKKPEQASPKTKSFYQSIYPESVRYALQYRGARMGKDEMRELIYKWQFESVYLVAKACAFDRECQRSFLEDLTRVYYKKDWAKKELDALLHRYIDLLPDDVYVTGTKLAQLSRTGSDRWQAEWKQLAMGLATEAPEVLPCIIAHTPIYGFHHFISAYRDAGHKKLLLLMPDWLVDQDDPQMGYEITLGDELRVTLQVQDECLLGSWLCEGIDCKLKKRSCTDAVFVDDTINSGSTAGKLQSFWLTHYGLNVPIDRVRVITDMRKRN